MRTGRGKSRKNLDLIDAAYAILAEIQPASVRAAKWPRSISGPVAEYSDDGDA